VAEVEEASNSKPNWVGKVIGNVLIESGPLIVPTGLLVLTILCIIFALPSSITGLFTKSTSLTPEQSSIGLSSPALSVSNGKTIFYLAQTDLNRTDIISVTSLMTATLYITKNITQDPGSDWSESWPTPSHGGDMLAYFGIDQNNKTAIFIHFSDGTWKNSERQNASSKLGSDYQVIVNHPPLWSPDDHWIAFLGQNLHTQEPVWELFVMPAATGETSD